jgi:hypothetical protein
MSYKNQFLIFDFETGDLDKDTCPVLQIAADIYDYKTLEHIDHFDSYIRPMKAVQRETISKKTGEKKIRTVPVVLTDEEILDENGPIKRDALIKNNIKREDIITYPLEKLVWGNFVDFCLKHKSGKDQFSKVFPVGWNIIGFDIPILSRLTRLHKSTFPVHPWLYMDMMQIFFYCSNHLTGEAEVQSYAMDYMRSYLGLEGDDEIGLAHSATRDVADTGKFFVRHVKWMRSVAKKAKFKGAFAENSNGQIA